MNRVPPPPQKSGTNRPNPPNRSAANSKRPKPPKINDN